MTQPRCPRIWQIEACRDGRLTGSAVESVASHVSRCAECGEERARVESTIDGLRSDEVPEFDDLRVARLRERILARVDESFVTRRPPRARAAWSVAAAAIVLVALGLGRSLTHDSRASEAMRVARVTITRGYAGARFTRRAERDHEVVALVEGELHVRVRHPASSRRSGAVVIHVPDGVIHDEGTSFRVHVRDGRTDSIVVSEGRVAFVQRDGTVIHIGAGQHWARPAEAFHGPAPSGASLSPAASAASTAPLASNRARATTGATTHVEAQAVVEVEAASSSPEVESEEAEDRLYLDAVELLRHGQQARARGAATAYLARYPTGFRRVEMQRLVDTIAPE